MQFLSPGSFWFQKFQLVNESTIGETKKQKNLTPIYVDTWPNSKVAIPFTPMKLITLLLILLEVSVDSFQEYLLKPY